MSIEFQNDPRVDKYIRDLEASDKSQIIQVTELFRDRGFLLSTVHLKKLRMNIWELRGGRYRLLFSMIGDMAIGLHIFHKKTQKTPKKEIELTLKRYREYI